MRSCFALLSALPLLGAFAQAPAYARERSRIDSLVSAALNNPPTAGIAVAVIRGRDTLAVRGWGFADVENDVVLTPDHVFRIGSITKQFTSAAIMQLVEKGRLSLDDTLGALLRYVPTPWHKVTLRQLLNHTSGIPSYTDLGAPWRRRWREDMGPDSLIFLTAGDTLNFAPGTKWRYNNTGYVLLGRILESVTAMPYGKYLEDQLFKPLGLTSTTYCSTREPLKRRAHGYDYDRTGKRFLNAEYLSMTQPYAAGALCSTVGDLVKWTQALHGGAVVSTASFAHMTTPAGAAASFRYGFGLVVDTIVAGHRRVTHGGGIHGFVSHLSYFPHDSLTVVVLANTIPAVPDVIANNIARIVFGAPLLGAPAASDRRD